MIEALFGKLSFNDIINNLLSFLYFILDFFFGWINLPQMSKELINSIDTYMDLIFDNLSALGFFIRPTTLKILIPLIIFIINFKYIYKIVIWLIRKLPFINIK